MMTTTIRKTVDIPADRRLYLELPQDTPTGAAEVIVFVPVNAEPESAVSAPFPTMEELDADARRKTAERKATGKDPALEIRDSLKGRQIFGVDGVAYQRKIRDEWER
jgi:hypothetical protein